LARVYIENKGYEDLIASFDRPDTFFYLDPPYYGWRTIILLSSPRKITSCNSLLTKFFTMGRLQMVIAKSVTPIISTILEEGLGKDTIWASLYGQEESRTVSTSYEIS
jgi:hypothetical protein